jgi:hypothetical protein
MRCLGLMSGTSADGVDAVLADFRGSPNHPQWDLIRHVHHPYSEALRHRVVSAGQGEPSRADQWLDLAEAITEAQATAARSCDPHGEAVLVGCHGQTIWHRPPHIPTAGCQLATSPGSTPRATVRASCSARLSCGRPCPRRSRCASCSEGRCSTFGRNKGLARPAQSGRHCQSHVDPLPAVAPTVMHRCRDGIADPPTA